MKGHTELPTPRADLLPCPFCGGKNIFFNAPDPSISFKGSINCPACLASMPREVSDDQELINCWNTRAVNTYPAVTELVKALELAVIVLNDGPTRVVARSALSHYRELAGTSNEVAGS